MPRTLPLLAAAAAGGLAYSAGYEVRAYTVRRKQVPVLTPGAKPIRLLHVSDLHLLARHHRRIEFVRSLIELRPHLVVNTGDTMSSAHSIPAVLRAFEPLSAVPAAFVPGNNDYYAPKPKNPVRYFRPKIIDVHNRAPLPWDECARALVRDGWVDLTHQRAALQVGDAMVALTGVDDPHLRKADYDLVAGPADPSAVVRIGAMHVPEPELIDRFAADGYDLVLAGHTHGGQVRVPFGPAIVTNCGIDHRRARGLHPWDDRMWYHVSAGLGTNPYLPVRFCCRPEATLLTLVARGESGPAH